jgi:hypothetical protein
MGRMFLGMIKYQGIPAGGTGIIEAVTGQHKNSPLKDIGL